MAGNDYKTIRLRTATAVRISTICERWNNIEQQLKEYELTAGGVAIPSINELRYAGRRLIDALNVIVNHPNPTEDKAIEQIEEHLIEAERCCENADHDIVDARTSSSASTK